MTKIEHNRGKALRFITLLLMALALAPGLAHLLEMYHKMELTQESYGAAQHLYQGWALPGIVQAAALVFTAMLAFSERRRGGHFGIVLGAFICLFLTLVIFFVFTYPVNRITNNWNLLPEDWTRLRQQWEYSHGAGALLELAAYILLLWAIVKGRTRRRIVF